MRSWLTQWVAHSSLKGYDPCFLALWSLDIRPAPPTTTASATSSASTGGAAAAAWYQTHPFSSLPSLSASFPSLPKSILEPTVDKWIAQLPPTIQKQVVAARDHLHRSSLSTSPSAAPLLSPPSDPPTPAPTQEVSVTSPKEVQHTPSISSRATKKKSASTSSTSKQ